MKKRLDPVGRLLLRSGVLDEDQIADVLDHQRRSLPFASQCYVLGHVEEEPLVRALSKQRGVPGIVLSKCVIRLSVLDEVPAEFALRHSIMPVLEDANRVFVAVEDPSHAALRELGFMRGKAVVPHIGLHVSVARAIRAGYAAHARGERLLVGDQVTGRLPDEAPERMWVVSDIDELPGEMTNEPPPDGSADDITDITRELFEDLSEEQTTNGEIERPADLNSSGIHSSIELVPSPTSGVIDLDSGSARPPAVSGPARVLIVDDDFATRHLLVKVLAPDGYQTDTAAGGMEAVKALRSNAPDLVVIDIMLPEVDGFQICRSIKSSRKYRHIPVILLSAVIDSGRVTDDVLTRYGAEAYFEKPINTERLRKKIAALLGERSERVPSEDDRSFDHALELYREGKLEEAIETLRAGLAHDPLSTKHHFVLANLLQKKSLIYEAIDEYEATVNLKPDYFPALSRLAYLYYKKGFSARAIETWRRSLPHCPDAALRENIEVFMRKLIADMQLER